MYITLATRRDNVDYINDKKLAELPGDPVTFYGEIMGDFPESSLPTSQELVLKPGAQIIFIKNDFDRRWVNGTIGVISGFDPIEETLYVITDDGKECDVKRESWRNIRYKYNEERNRLKRKSWEPLHNIPCAWHGPSPSTRARADLQPGSHRLYRRRVCRWAGIRSPQPLHLAGRHPAEKAHQPCRCIRASGDCQLLRTLQQPHRHRPCLEASTGRRSIRCRRQSLHKGDFDTFLDEFFKAIHSRYDIEKPNVQRLIRRKLNIINRLKEENRALKQAALEKEKALVKYAREYILMGDECLKHDMKEAAMKNYEKAVTLCPKFKEAWKKIKKLEKEMLKR